MKMKKYILGATFFLATAAIYVNAQSKIMSLGFVAPQVVHLSEVFQPQVGEIVYQSDDASFYGYDQTSNWVKLSAGGAGDSMPSGTVVPFAGSTAPAGFLLADGSAVSRSTYSALFSAIGTTYGSGDGSTTFNLPDLRGIFVRGAGSQTISSITYSGTLAAKQGDQMQGHIHQFPTYNINGVTGDFTPSAQNSTLYGNKNTSSPISDGTNGTPRTGNETRPANISMNYIIKI